MLGAFLDRISSTFSRYFLISYVFPVLIIASINGLLLYYHEPATRQLVVLFAVSGGGSQAVYGTIILAAIGVLAYCLSGLSVKLRELLEGKHWPDGRFARWLLSSRLQQREAERLRQCAERNIDARLKRRRFRTSRARWIATLAEARKAGSETGQLPTANPDETEAAQAIRDIRIRIETNNEVSADSVEIAVDLLASVLRTVTADAEEDPNGYSLALNDLQETINLSISAAIRRLEREYTDTFIDRQSRFGRDIIRPTEFGNIAEALHDYAATRYLLSLDTFWPRLQAVIQKDEDFFAVVQESKTQLDFLVSLFWLAAATVVIWFVILGWSTNNAALFISIAVGGPLVLWILYRLATTAYATFAGIIRSSVDLFRFELLEALHIGLPRSLTRERAVWNGLNRLSGYGEDVRLYYHHP